MNLCDDIGNVAVLRNANIENAMSLIRDARLSVAKAEHRIQLHLGKPPCEHFKRERRHLDRKYSGAEAFDDF